MTKVKSTADDAEEFIKNAENYWAEIRGGTSKGANACVRRNESILKRHAKSGTAVTFLESLVDHVSAPVRFAAAAFLLNYEANQHAIEVLKRLKASKDIGGISVSAGMVLDVNKIEKY
jgi:hypothetical protein